MYGAAVRFPADWQGDISTLIPALVGVVVWRNPQ